MKRIIQFLIRYIIFWLVVFLINRIVFLISAASYFPEETFLHVLQALVSGWLLDLATAGYLLPIPGLLMTLFVATGRRWILVLMDIMVAFFIVVYCLTCFGELLLYREWMTKLTMQALLHFKHPAEVFRTAQLHTSVIFFVMSIIFSAGYIFIYNRKISERKRGAAEHSTGSGKAIAVSASVILFVPINFLMIRGGWRAIPISDSDAYYSSSHILNDAAVNPLWSLAHNIIEYTTHQDENPYVFMSAAEADQGLKAMMAVEKDTTVYFLSAEKPNLVYIILEGYTAYALPNFGGDNYAPFMDSLSREGLAFTRCYAAAYASDQGIPAILSAYPSTPKIAITNQSSKTVHLPCISRDMKARGYECGFIFGGQLNYGNIKSYLYNTGFDKVIERGNFPESTPDGHLGIQDQDMAPLAVGELNKAKEPFLYAWFTISTHSPYDISAPMKDLTEKQNQYVNTLVYSDEAIRNFFTEAQKQPWYKNTLFVFISDHSHFNHRDINIDNQEYHRLVSFFYGDVIKTGYRGKKIDKVISQMDLTPTLLKQFQINTDQYVFGKNMMNPYTKTFAYFDYHYGSGFITDSCFISRRDRSDEILIQTCQDLTSNKLLKHQHEVFLQKTFQDYLSR